MFAPLCCTKTPDRKAVADRVVATNAFLSVLWGTRDTTRTPQGQSTLLLRPQPVGAASSTLSRLCMTPLASPALVCDSALITRHAKREERAPQLRAREKFACSRRAWRAWRTRATTKKKLATSDLPKMAR
jgi:hypothetical protein